MSYQIILKDNKDNIKDNIEDNIFDCFLKKYNRM